LPKSARAAACIGQNLVLKLTVSALILFVETACFSAEICFAKIKFTVSFLQHKP